MNLFDELCKDAAADIESGVYMNVSQEQKTITDAVAEMEKKMTEQMEKHVKQYETMLNNKGKLPDDAPVNNVPETKNNDGEESTENNEVE